MAANKKPRTALGKRLVAARAQADGPGGGKITQVAAGAAVGISGVALGSWESGEVEAPISAAIALAKLYGVRPEWLILGTGPMVADLRRDRRPAVSGGG